MDVVALDTIQAVVEHSVYPLVVPLEPVNIDRLLDSIIQLGWFEFL